MENLKSPKQFNEENSVYNLVYNAGKLLSPAIETGLVAEVVVWALDYMKLHPHATPNECIEYGLSEWVK